MRRFVIAVVALTSLVLVPNLLVADNPGQADLDAAADLQITAETLGDLEKVVKLAESALEKGLDKGQQEFAKKLLAATLYQHANRSSEPLFERRRRDPRGTIRDQSLKDLEKAKRYDPTLPDIYMLEAKLRALPGGDLKAACRGRDRGDQAVQDEGRSEAAWQGVYPAGSVDGRRRPQAGRFRRGREGRSKQFRRRAGDGPLVHQKGDNEKAVATLQKLLEQDPDNPNLLAVLAEALTDLKKYDEALKYCDGVIKQAPRATIGLQLAGPREGDEGRHSRRDQRPRRIAGDQRQTICRPCSCGAACTPRRATTTWPKRTTTGC